MTKLLQRLLNELQDRGAHDYLRCSHGGVLYPPNWNTKTREKAVAEGILKICDCTLHCMPTGYPGWLYLIRQPSQQGGEK